MGREEKNQIAAGVFAVGGPTLSDDLDCLSYLVFNPEAEGPSVLVDCGAGRSIDRILAKVREIRPGGPDILLLSHVHIDHAGGAARLKELCGCRILVHAAESRILANGDAVRSAAEWYRMDLQPVEPDEVLYGGEEIDLGGGLNLKVVAIPGHTPGSLAAWLDTPDGRVLFGQDIHGPFDPSFESDLDQWSESMKTLLALKADILAEGHYGIFSPAEEVRSFIEQQCRMNL